MAERTEQLQVRFSAEELALLRAAAENVGRTLSGWVRERLLRIARNELEGRDV